MNEHSTIMGGSNCDQRVNCPGSHALEEQMPKEPESDFAKQGTQYHTCMELLLAAGYANMAEAEQALTDLVGQDLGFGEEGDDGEWVLTKEKVDTKVRPALEVWFQFCAEFDIDDYFVEARVTPLGIPELVQCFGTLDILAKSVNKDIHFLDWKFGDGIPVEPHGSYQMGFYGVGALYDDDAEMQMLLCGSHEVELPDGSKTEVPNDDIDVGRVFFHIVQPRVGANRIWEYWETSVDWLEDAADSMVQAVTLAKQPNAPIKAGDHCRWCQAKPICPAHAEMGDVALKSDPSSMTAVELSAALKKAELLKGWCSSVFALGQRELEDGNTVPGYKLVKKQPQRQWIDGDHTEQYLRNKRVKIDDMYDKKMKSPAQMEKSLGKKMYSKSLSKHVHSVSSGLTMVTDDDKRPAVANSMSLLTNALEKTNAQLADGKKLADVK